MSNELLGTISLLYKNLCVCVYVIVKKKMGQCSDRIEFIMSNTTKH